MSTDQYKLSPRGQKIYSHKPQEDGGVKIPKESGVYIDDIEKYMDKTFGAREHLVYHEIVSDIVHVDVHVLMPIKGDNRYILFTTGMSDLPMSLPNHLLSEKKRLERAELVIYLPGNWNMENQDEKHYWPIRLLTTLARLPHEYKAWLGYGHSIFNHNYESYAKGTKLCGSVLVSSGVDDNNVITTEDGTVINIYLIMPVYKQEVKYCLRYNVNKLIDKFSNAGITNIVDIKRKNVCSIFH